MIKTIKYFVITAIIFMTAMSETSAQSGTYYTVRDMEMWSSIELKYKINKKWNLLFEEQLRLKDNANTVDIYFSELNLEYQIAKPLTLGFGTRLIRDNDNVGKIQGYENHLRWNVDAAYKHKYNQFDIKYRIRYQSKNDVGISMEEGDLLENALRFKLTTTYNIKKWKLDPQFSSEIFNQIQPATAFDKIRFSLGTEYETKKAGDFGLFYMMEKQLTDFYPKTTNIIGLKYKYTLNKK
jgi:flagellar basal body rod protein FlgB